MNIINPSNPMSINQDIFSNAASHNKCVNKHNIHTLNKAQHSLNTSKGFTLLELMVAMALGTFIILGIVGTYSSISASSQASKELENAQEVIRYSSNVFTRSLKQTTEPLTFANGNQTITVTQKANTRSCLGTIVAVDYIENFTFIQPDLRCQITNLVGVEIVANTLLLTGIADLQSGLNGDLFTLNVTPTVLPRNFGNDGIRIDIALSSKIMRDAMNAN
jgi:prepilin-type N-terminal cleavage/methylation domain-containing protein